MASRVTARRKAALKRKNLRTRLRVKGLMKVRGSRRMKVRNCKEKRALLNQR
ncbi:MAG TPA: hypothetical protein PKA64_22645 [Myxococcota bacterium]|nr:hypothetical protein [Myxococcota bacterium]